MAQILRLRVILDTEEDVFRDIEIQTDALREGQRVVILDDLLATGGTLAASVKLCTSVGAEVVGCGVVIDLPFLNGRDAVDAPVHALVAYDT